MTHNEQARALAGGHYYCDDGWYSCPLAPDGCWNDAVESGRCNCAYEQRVIAIAVALREAEARGLEEAGMNCSASDYEMREWCRCQAAARRGGTP